MSSEDVQDDWAFYYSRIDGHIAAILVNLGLRKPLASHPCLFTCAIELQKPNEDGFQTSEENEEILYPLEDALRAALLAIEPRIVNVGRMTYDGKVQHCFYYPAASKNMLGKLLGNTGTSEKLERAAAEVMQVFPSYRFTTQTSDDVDWDLFFSCLYPSEWEKHTISNQQVLLHARSHGDQTDKPRVIEHFIVCPTLEIQQRIIAGALALGFEAFDCPREADEPPNGYDVEARKTSIPDDIDSIMWPLFELTKEHGASYDGWASVVWSGRMDLPPSNSRPPERRRKLLQADAHGAERRVIAQIGGAAEQKIG